MSATTWKARWEMVNVAERPNTIDDDMIQEINPVLYLNMYTTVVILLVMSVSTAAADWPLIMSTLTRCLMHPYENIL